MSTILLYFYNRTNVSRSLTYIFGRGRTSIKIGDALKNSTRKGIDSNLAEDHVALNKFHAREDSVKYTELLRKILAIFGQGIIDSLEFTNMGN